MVEVDINVTTKEGVSYCEIDGVSVKWSDSLEAEVDINVTTKERKTARVRNRRATCPSESRHAGAKRPEEEELGEKREVSIRVNGDARVDLLVRGESTRAEMERMHACEKER
ncbi:hypothetical protein AMTR_s00033p00140510 [Amborella trichopoda]|uniref:Uncharacterized protein n=1 Tax=Amborella trichopoda TaxID=13333 RepID=U5D1K1_AMBTC|nr:hypothetical protein AMTR_s00033p00140510 [Amborella trichopoda]